MENISAIPPIPEIQIPIIPEIKDYVTIPSLVCQGIPDYIALIPPIPSIIDEYWTLPQGSEIIVDSVTIPTKIIIDPSGVPDKIEVKFDIDEYNKKHPGCIQIIPVPPKD